MFRRPQPARPAGLAQCRARDQHRERIGFLLAIEKAAVVTYTLDEAPGEVARDQPLRRSIPPSPNPLVWQDDPKTIIAAAKEGTNR